MDQNPLKNLKILYAIGIKLENNEDKGWWGIKNHKRWNNFWCKELLEDVKKIVDEEKSNTPGWEKLLFSSYLEM